MSEEKKIDLEALARAIAPHLDGESWRHVPQPAGRDGHAVIAGPGGAEIHLGQSWPRGRVQVSGGYPRDHHNRYVVDSVKSYSESLPSITVAATRPPQAVAADIARRFLPEYLGLLAKAQAEIDRRLAYEKKRDALLDFACGFLGTVQFGQATDYKRSTGTQLAPGVSIHVEADDEAKVTLEFVGISTLQELRAVLDQAGKVAKLLRQ
jgi:hypothetical protein